MSLLSFDSKVRAAAMERGTISGGGPNISFPVSSLVLAFDICFWVFASKSVCKVPLSSRCFATSGIEVGFLGLTLSSVLNDIWLTPFIACWDAMQLQEKQKKTRTLLSENRVQFDVWKMPIRSQTGLKIKEISQI